MNVLYPLASPTEARKNHDAGFRRVVVPAYPRLCAQGKRRRLKRCLEALPDLGPALAVLLLHVEELCENLGKSQHEKNRENRNHVHSKNHVIHHVDQGELVLRNSPKIYCTRSVPWQVHDLALLAAELSQQVWPNRPHVACVLVACMHLLGSTQRATAYGFRAQRAFQQYQSTEIAQRKAVKTMRRPEPSTYIKVISSQRGLTTPGFFFSFGLHNGASCEKDFTPLQKSGHSRWQD